MLSEVDELRLYVVRLELGLEPVCHLDDVAAVLAIAAHTAEVSMSAAMDEDAHLGMATASARR